MQLLLPVVLYACAVAGLFIPEGTIPFTEDFTRGEILTRDTTCENTATSRSCWGEFDIDTDYYDIIPDTGVTREYWLLAQLLTAAPDGYEKQILAFNGTVPGPTIWADWGDNVIVHVTNEIPDNGTSVHWHGIRQLNNNEMDGVPGVTQCPIAPGQSMTYEWRAQQYGTSWYHSHFSVQVVDGLSGPIIINGPATADYDEHLGALFLTDWSHDTAFEAWGGLLGEARGGFPIVPNGLINGTNTYDCTDSTDVACLGTGQRFELTFVSGMKYRIGLVGAQGDGFLRFTLDSHNFTVIANDFVPVVPYVTDSVVVGGGQRYDIIIEADQAVGSYWMRSVVEGCNVIINANGDNIRGIVRYEGVADTTSDPTTIMAADVPDVCRDLSIASLTPHLSKTVGSETTRLTEAVNWYYDIPAGLIYHWTFNTVALEIDWAAPTLQLIQNGSSFPTAYNVEEITAVNEWIYVVIQDLSLLDANHPIHLHGHDYYVLAQGFGLFVPGITQLNLVNPPRRDTATLPGDGFMVIAFYTDNPGTWMMHCHIIWHASQGLAMQFVERGTEIEATLDSDLLDDVCEAWNVYTPTELYVQDDSGI